MRVSIECLGHYMRRHFSSLGYLSEILQQGDNLFAESETSPDAESVRKVLLICGRLASHLFTAAKAMSEDSRNEEAFRPLRLALRSFADFLGSLQYLDSMRRAHW